MTKPTRAPRVSIGLPVYNAQQFVEQAIDSLLEQTFEDFELIISDNASTDATEEICRAYEARDPRIRYVRQKENVGAVPNFNRVFQLARGALFKWAAFDDICAPTFVERCVAVLEADADVAWCHPRSTHIDPDGRELPGEDLRDVSYARSSPRLKGATRESKDVQDRFRAVLLGDGGCLDSYGVIRSHVIRKTQMYLPYYGSEKVFIAELGLHGRFREIPEILFFPRIHSGCSASLDSADAQQSFIAANQKHRPSLARLHLLAGYSRAIRRSRLSANAQMRCFAVLGHYILQISKWRDVVQRLLTAKGVGGRNLEIAPAIDEKESP